MSAFADLMPDADMMAILGDDAVYTPAGKTPVTLKAIIEHNNERIGSEAYTTELQTEVEFLKASVPHLPQRGDRIALGLMNYHVDSVISDDGVYVRLAVRK